MNKLKLRQLLNILIEQEDNILKLRGVRGYGVGHPIYKTGKVSTHLGPQDEDEKVQQEKEPVKISKAFKNKKRK